jgi:hypothetical protein
MLSARRTLVRRRLVEDSIALMRRLHLIEVVHDEQKGIAYRAGDDAPALVGLLRTKYTTDLKVRAKWLVAEPGGPR